MESLSTLSLIFTSMVAASAAASTTQSDAALNFTSQLIKPPSSQSTNAGLIAHLSIFKAVVHSITPDQVYSMWLSVRAEAIAPALQVVVWMCMVMSVMLVVEATYMALVSLGVKIIGWRPEQQYKWEAIREDEEKGSSAYPMVLVQIPMYNEIEVWCVVPGSSPFVSNGEVKFYLFI